jgi:[lysine-biosynthesis-protein LysW]--L-2-aminoadipate ligase
MHCGVLYTRIREDEKLLAGALRAAGHDVTKVDVVNDPLTTAICADKVWGSVALLSAGVPTPRTTVAFTPESALAAIEEFGYPCVLKPVTGSWGRLVSRIDTRAAAETVLEHKDVLGGYEHKLFYVQEYVEKPGRDIRVSTCDAEPVVAMTRTSDHWLTTAARGATTAEFELDDATVAVADRLTG